MARGTQRRFVVDRHTGLITIRPKAGAAHPGDSGPSDDFELLDALIEVEELLSPVFAQDRVSPVDLIALLADAMYLRLTGELETPSRELRIKLCEYILSVWSRGLFTPSAACPYTIEEILAASQSEALLREQEEQLDGETIRAALTAALEQPSPVDDGQMSPYERLKHDMKDIDQRRDELVRRGVGALHNKQYERAERYFRQAMQADMLDESEACYYLALCRLWQLDFDEASYLFEVDSQDREGEAPLSWLLAAWCAIGASSSLSAYLASIRDEMDDDQDPLAHLQALFDYDYEEYEDLSLQDLASALFAYLRGEHYACLELLDAFVPDVLEIPAWFVPFWSAMALASLGEYDEADSMLCEARHAGIPPLLLLPLRWFEQSHPEFFERSVSPAFTYYDLWKQIAARNEREQLVREERRNHLQWLVDHIDEEFPGYSPVLRELDAMRERGRAAKRTTALECRYLAEPSGEAFAHTYAEIAEHLQMGSGQALPVFLAQIPPPCSPRPVTYLVSALLEQLGDPRAHKRGSEAQKRARLVRHLQVRQIEMVVLTRIDYLTTPAAGQVLSGEIEWIRRLFVDEIGSIPLLLVGGRAMIEEMCEINAGLGRLLAELAPARDSSQL